MNELALIEATELRDFYQAQINEIEAKLARRVGTYQDILTHETLSIRTHKLNLTINTLMNRRRAKASLWNKFWNK